ncbi:MAG: outer membrane lipid asymmetry maintenance protein MlaD [Myxococcota bacterium]
MQSSPMRDLIVGLFVGVGLLAVGYLSLNLGGFSLTPEDNVELHATFNQIGGLAERAPVVISGVRVGRVKRIALADDLRARVTFEVNAGLELPVDTSASIRTAGLLGDQFIELEPGAEDALLDSGGEIGFTESALSIESLVGQLVHDAGLGEDEE